MMQSYSLLEEAPTHSSENFVKFLRERNPVVLETEYWLVIENCKYHTVQFPHLTVFPKQYGATWADLSVEEVADLRMIFDKYSDWYKYENVKHNRTVERIHFHVVKDYENWLVNSFKTFKHYEDKLKKQKYKAGRFNLFKRINEWATGKDRKEASI